MIVFSFTIEVSLPCFRKKITGKGTGVMVPVPEEQKHYRESLACF